MYAGGPGGDPRLGLMGNVAPNPMAGLMGPQMGIQPYQIGTMNSPQFAQPQNGGPWSQLAYQMAGRPNQGPYASVATPQGVPDASGGSQSGVGALGGTALGLLGSVAQNPGMAKTLGNLGTSALSKLGLLGGGLDTAAIGSAAGAAGAEIGAGAGAGMASTAADVAAANSAWMSSPAAASAWGTVGTPAAVQAAASGTGAGLGSGAAAGGAAEGLGAGTAGGAGAGTSGSGAAGAGLGATAGALTAVAVPLAIAAYGASKNPYDLNAKYYDTVKTQANNLLSQGLNASNTGDWQALMSNMQKGQTGFAPPEIQALQQKLQSGWDNYTMSRNGMTQAQIDQWKTPGGASAAAAAYRAATGGLGMSGNGGPVKGSVRY